MSDLGGYDFDILDAELLELDEMGVDMTQFGFEDMSVFDEPGEPETEEDDEPETPAEVTNEPKKQFKLLVICNDGAELQNLFEELTEKGYKCQLP